MECLLNIAFKRKTFVECLKKHTVFLFFSSLKRLSELKRQCLEKEERFQSIAGLSTMKTNLEYLKHEMAWAVVMFT